MRFNPISEEQAKADQAKFKPWEPGQYDFVVQDAEEKLSSKNNDMLVVELKVYHPDGREKSITDYIVEAMGFKLRHLAYACGRGQSYETGEMTADELIGCNGRVALRIKKAEGNYPAKNEVQDYIVPQQYQQQRDANETKAIREKSKPAVIGAMGGGSHTPVPDEDIPFAPQFSKCFI